MNNDFPRIKRLPPYVFNITNELKMAARHRGEDIIDLSMGNPDGDTPKHIVDKMVEVAQRPGTHGYSASRGIPRLRKAISDWYKRRWDVDIDPDKEAIVTIGSKEGIAHLMLATCDRGDTVLVPNPSYPIHIYGSIIAGADVRSVRMGPGIDFFSEFERAVTETTPKPKLMILGFPSNPTAQCVDLDFFEKLVALAKKHGVYIVHDLAYADIVYDGAKKLLLEEVVPEAEPVPAAQENPRHPKKKKAGPALRCVGVRGTSGREYRADAVLVATGGVSYPTTGSTGDGYKLAQQAGHTLVEPVPSLVSLVSRDPDCKKMMGLALKNVTLTLLEDGKAIFDEQGEMLFTHFGISGPLTLSASSHLGDMKKHRYIAEIDMKPALSEEQLYDRITRDFALLANHAAQGALVKLLPSSMQPVMVARWGIDPATKANQITREQKRELVQLVKHWQVSIDARGDLAHAVITSGGVSVREVDPKTMQSKKALGLYFAGEVLDVDAYTGGYNLQIAFCTAQSFANNL